MDGGWVDRRMGGWMDGWMGGGWTDGLVGGWMGRWMNGGWMDGWGLDGWMDDVCVGGGGGGGGGGANKFLYYQYVASMHSVINRTHGSNVL